MTNQFKSTNVVRSRYVQGGDTQVFSNRIGWWSKRTLPKSDTDLYVTITARYHQRPWVMAADYFGSDNLEWIVLQYNSILDPIEEFVQGVTVRIPTQQRLQLEILSKVAGGVTAVS